MVTMAYKLTALAVCLSLTLFAMSSHADWQQAKSQVKLTAQGGKIGADGLQAITIKMEIAKGWHAYANPVNNAELVDVQTEVKIAAPQKLASVKIDYPVGKQQKVGAEVYQVYEGDLEIKASVKRAAGDTGPLEVTVTYSVCNDNSCLPPETIKLQVK